MLPITPEEIIFPKVIIAFSKDFQKFLPKKIQKNLPKIQIFFVGLTSQSLVKEEFFRGVK